MYIIFPSRNSIYQRFSMAMLNSQMVYIYNHSYIHIYTYLLMYVLILYNPINTGVHIYIYIYIFYIHNTYLEGHHMFDDVWCQKNAQRRTAMEWDPDAWQYEFHMSGCSMKQICVLNRVWNLFSSLYNRGEIEGCVSKHI